MAKVGEDETIESLTEMVRQMQEKGEVKVIIGEGIDIIKIRKAMKFMCRKGEIMWKIIVRADEMTKERERMKRESLLIETGDDTYANVLNKMKSQVNVEGLIIKVENVKKTNGGDLIVKLKCRGAAERLRDELRNKMGEN